MQMKTIGSSDAIRYMVNNSGKTFREVSTQTGKQKGNLTARLYQRTRFTIDEFVKICDVCGWHLVLKKGKTEFELRGIDADHQE